MCTPKHTKNDLNRRDLLKGAAQYSALAGAASLVGSKAFGLARSAPSSSPEDQHFFLYINIPGGLDASYLFDARPLAMTGDKLIANYHGKDPILYRGTNGETTLRTSLTDPLMKFQDRFSVINGVVMSPNLVGHDQLMNVLLTGNPFGGDSFFPWTNKSGLPLDFITSGPIPLVQLNNIQGSMQLSPKACKDLGAKIQKIASNQSMIGQIQNRAELIGKGKTSLAASSRRMGSSVNSLGDLAGKLAQMTLNPSDMSSISDPRERFVKSIEQDITMLSESMRVGLTNAGVLLMFDNIDTHNAKAASELPLKIAMFSEAIAAVFTHLESVQMPSGRSMLDHTTFLIGTEFSRTMRQPGAPIDQTGTDHNALTNTLIVGGKGVRGGQVIGQSDFQSSTETLSPAHLSADPSKLSIMGRPFDFETNRSITGVLPQSFEVTQYIGASNVTNTIQDILGIPKERRFTYGRNLPVAGSIKTLIA